MRTMVAVPAQDQVAVQFAESLATLQIEGEGKVAFFVGSLVYESRNSLVKKALAMDADYILWIDSDMVFEPDLQKRLLADIKETGADMVTALCFRRRPPFTPCLFKKAGVKDGVGYHEEYPDYPKDSLFEIEGCGFGAVMMKTDLLLDIAAQSGNWFEPFGQFGEDIAFCVRMRQAGGRIFADSRVKVGHVGHMIVTESMYDAIKAER